MGQSAAGYESKIYKALLPCSGNAKGLFLVMRYWSELNLKRPGFVERDSRPMSREALAEEARCSTSAAGPDPFTELRGVKDDDDKPLLLKQEGRTFFLPLIASLHRFRQQGAVRKARFDAKRSDPSALRNADMGVTSGACNAGVSPLEVSSPITPPSLSPLLTHSAENPDPPGKLSSLRESSRQAFSAWSSVSLGRELRPENNEAKPIHDLIDFAMQCPPILRGRESIPRQNLVPQAADWARQNGKEYKSPKYAVAVVKSLLEEWSTKGMPGTGVNTSGSRNGTNHAALTPGKVKVRT